MDYSRIYSKTGKGLSEVINGCRDLSPDHARVLAMVNGALTVSQVYANLGAPQLRVVAALEALEEMGMIHVFAEGQSSGAGSANPKAGSGAAFDDFDVLPVLEVVEVSPEESVQAWAQARKGASELQQNGFFAYGSKPVRRAPGAALRAMVVEDDEDVAALLVALLGEKGFVVTVAADVGAALSEITCGDAPDLVLLDIVLPGVPGKDGFDVLKVIQRQPGWSGVPVIMVTSQVSDDQVMRGLKSNADAYIFKPFKWETLFSCIRSVVGI